MTESAILYHGCNRPVALRLKREGLKPRGERRTNWEKAPSVPDSVYLTTWAAPYYASCVGAYRHNGGAIVEIDRFALADDRLRADEDAIAHTLSAQRGVPMAEVMEEAKRIAVENPGEHNFALSLAKLGSAAYRGRIQPKAIRRIAIVAPDVSAPGGPQWWWQAMEPTMTMACYSMKGEFYRALTAMAFEPIDLDEFNFPPILADSDREFLAKVQAGLDRSKITIIR